MKLSLTFDQTTINAFKTTYSYPEQVPDPMDSQKLITNPETQEQFTERKIKEYITNIITAITINQSVETARTQAQNNLTFKLESAVDLTAQPK